MGEKAISKDQSYSYWYARDILKGRFLLGEQAISMDAWYSVEYAIHTLKGRFLLGEDNLKHTIHCNAYENYFNITL